MFFSNLISIFNIILRTCLNVNVQGGPEKIILETIDSFVVNSNFCELIVHPLRESKGRKI